MWLGLEGLQMEMIRLQPLDSRYETAVLKLYSDDRVARWLSRLPRPFDRSQARAFCIPRLQAENEYRFAALMGEESRFVGVGTLRLDDATKRTVILGYSVVPHGWNAGVGTQVARLLVNQATSIFDATTLQASPLKENHASCRILEKLGFRVDQEIRIDDTSTEVRYLLKCGRA